MSVARFSWVPNLYNLHLLLENHMCQPDPVNSYRDRISIQTFCGCWGQSRAAMVVRRCAVCRGLAGHRQAVLTCKQPLGCDWRMLDMEGDGIEDECGYWKRLLGLTRIWGRTLMVNVVPSCDPLLIYRQFSFRVWPDKLQAQGWKK